MGKIYFWYDKTRETCRVKGLPGKRCGAKTRRGTPCQKWAMHFKDRCHMHGGKSTGPKTKKGKERSALGRKMRGKKAILEWQEEFSMGIKEIWNRCRPIPMEEEMTRPWEWWDKWEELWKELKLEEPFWVANSIFDRIVWAWEKKIMG